MSSGLSLQRLRCEYFTNPLGITELEPRFSWELVSDLPNTVQASYQVICTTSSDTVWDSGTVQAADSIHVAYQGSALSSRQRVTWVVTVTDNHGRTVTSEPQSFEIGLLNPSDWSASWISGVLQGGNQTTSPVPYFRHEFTAAKEIASARLYVTALGIYECEINGQRVGESYFRPGWTDYAKRLQFDTHDVTALVKQGANAFGALVADGWYCGFVGMWPRANYGDKPALLAQLEITYTDGTTETIATDNSWKTSIGPNLEADLLMGQSYDAQRELTGWSIEGYDDSKWWEVQPVVAPTVPLVASPGPHVVCTQELSPLEDPKNSSSWQGGRWVFDLGQNMVGTVRIVLKGPAGVTAKIRYAEILDEKGNPYYANLRSAKATDVYTLKGDPEGETFEPRLTFHGFRYIEVTGRPAGLEVLSVTGRVLHSDTPWTGSFECSDPLINQLQSNIQWGQRGNFLEVPTDCP